MAAGIGIEPANKTEAVMKVVRGFIQHNANSLHVYCRLCGYIPTPWAKKITKLYEKSIHRLVYAI